MIERCQIFTPQTNVIELLDLVGYKDDLYGKKIIENACGDGQVLTVVVKRYIEDCKKKDMALSHIKAGLETDIFGAEIDEIHYHSCVYNLNIVAETYGIRDVKWNILNIDILKICFLFKFDYVVGNPPYITYRDLDLETRALLKSIYRSCSQGKFDYCYAFIESGLDCLNDTGKMSYLIPSNIFKTVFAQNLRNLMLPYLTNIYDYTTKKLFENALTSSAIVLFEKGNEQETIRYHDIVNSSDRIIKKTDLTQKWKFKLISKSGPNRFRDFFMASNTVATLLNKAFVINDFKEFDHYVLTKEILIERTMCRETASPRTLNYGKNELIIFPYSFSNNILVKYEEETLKDHYPGAYVYLSKFKNELMERDSDKSIKWFEYGRSQALSHMNQPKLLTSSVVTNQVNVYDLDSENIPYSGIYITAKAEYSLSVAKKILQSDEFLDYVNQIGINASGVSMRITSKDINNFQFDINNYK